MWGAIIGGAVSAIGSLLGGSSKPKTQKTTTTSHVDYKRMVRDAEAAGFNPLTALRNGGAAGFSSSTGTTTESGGGPTFGAYVGAALSGGAQAWLAHDPHKEARAQKEFDLLDAQLRNLDAETNSLNKYGSLNPAVRPAGQAVSGIGGASRPHRWGLGMAAQDASDEFGDVVGELQGGVVNSAQNLWDGFLHKNRDVFDYFGGSSDRLRVTVRP